MKVCRAAAFALFGWYLMLPPSIPPGSPLGYKRPLSQWQVVRAFDNAEQCEEYKGTFFDSARQERAFGVLAPAYRNYMFAQCVASDDPRLRPR
jgi:hypothetical protein